MMIWARHTCIKCVWDITNWYKMDWVLVGVQFCYITSEWRSRGLRATLWRVRCYVTTQAGATRAHEVRTLQRTYFMTDVAEVTTRHAWIWRGIAGGGYSWPYAATRKHGGSEISMVKHRQQQKQQNDEAQWKMKQQLIQEDNRIRQVTNVKLAPVWPAPFESTQKCDVTQQGSTCLLA
jgi:hypothetical protein